MNGHPIVLDACTVLKRALEGFRNRSLQAFNPAETKPAYSRGCPIGLAFSPRELSYLKMHHGEPGVVSSDVTRLPALVKYKVVTAPEAELDLLIHLQETHDEILRSRGDRTEALAHLGRVIHACIRKLPPKLLPVTNPPEPAVESFPETIDLDTTG